MKICNAYFLPKKIEEATALLKQYNGEARIIAGGTDLIIDLKIKKKKVNVLVDISKVEGLNEIRFENGRFSLGAMVTHAQVSKSELVRKWAPVLAEASSAIGSPQIRNMGTLVGNVVNAMPAADGALALIVLNATGKIIDCDNKERVVPIHSLYRGVGDSRIDSTREILKEIEFFLPSSPYGSSFERLSKRKALSLPIINVAVFLRLNQELSIFEEVRIVLGPVAPIPYRPEKAENLLRRSEITKKVIKEAARLASEEASPRNSIRGGTLYRKEMIKILIERGIWRSLYQINSKFKDLSSY
jgi:carbon-monoxide dehydrogenase medium subunit